MLGKDDHIYLIDFGIHINMFNLLLFLIFKVQKWKLEMMKLVYNHNYGIPFGFFYKMKMILIIVQEELILIDLII